MTATLDGEKIRKSIATAQPTRKGDILADKLSDYIGTTTEIRVTCALICRYSAKLHRLAEEACNGPSWMNASDYRIGDLYRREGDSESFRAARDRHSARMDRWQTEMDALQESTEARMRWLVEFLPSYDGVAWRLNAETDPRGCSVILGSSDVRNGICVPNR